MTRTVIAVGSQVPSEPQIVALTLVFTTRLHLILLHLLDLPTTSKKKIPGISSLKKVSTLLTGLQGVIKT